MSHSLSFDSTGPAFAHTVVFLHGAGRGRASWLPIVDSVRKEHHCLVPELPLDTDAATGSRCFAEGARELADFIVDEAHGGRAHVVGVGIGSQFGVQLAVNHPARVRSLMLCGFRASAIDPVDRRTGTYRDRPDRDDHVDTPWLLRVLRRADDFRVPEPLQECEVPTSVVVGSLEAGGRRSADLLASRFSAASVVTVPDAGPGWYTRPQRLLGHIGDWLGDGDVAPPSHRAATPVSGPRRRSHLTLVS